MTTVAIALLAVGVILVLAAIRDETPLALVSNAIGR